MAPVLIRMINVSSLLQRGMDINFCAFIWTIVLKQETKVAQKSL